MVVRSSTVVEVDMEVEANMVGEVNMGVEANIVETLREEQCTMSAAGQALTEAVVGASERKERGTGEERM